MIPLRSSIKWLFVFLSFLPPLAGCGHTRDLSHGPSPIAADEAVVFGKVVVLENGVDRTALSPSFPFSGSVNVKEENANFFPAKALGKDGRFYWVVSRTRQEMHNLMYRHGVSIEPQAAFQVPDGAEACYVGTLVVDIKADKTFLGGLDAKGLNGILVRDEFEKEKGVFAARYPKYAGNVQHCPMVIVSDASFYPICGLECFYDDLKTEVKSRLMEAAMRELISALTR